MRFGFPLRRFTRAKRGMAAVEFALIAPMMVFLLLGSVELLDALSANRRAQNTAASLADVVARDNAISNAEVTGLWAAIEILMFPDPGNTAVDMRVTSIFVENASTARVVWSEGHNAYSGLPNNSTVSLPAEMMVPNTGLIRTDIRYHYAAPLNVLFGGGASMEHSAYRRARLVDPIPRVN